jgi:hypothetical protein
VRFTAAAWALHPINLMAVLFVVQRMESLSHTFVFAGLWLYLDGRQRQIAGRRGGWVSILAGLVGATGLGALAKESAVLLPLYAFLLEWCLPGLRGFRRDPRLAWLFACVLLLPALLGGGWLLYRASSPTAFSYRDFTLGERLLTEGRVVMDYLRWTLLPSLGELSLYHDDYVISRGPWQPPTTLPALAGIAALAAAAVLLRRRRPLLALGMLWFLGAQALTATFMPLELVYEHRNYFASLGVCLAAGDLLLLAPRPGALRRVALLVAGLAVAWFAATTWLRASEWSDPYRFASSEAAKHPRSPRATYALGQLLIRMSGYRPDSPLVGAANETLERSRRLPASGILPHAGLLMLAANTGAPIRPEWWADMQARLRERPIGPQEINALGGLSTCAREGHCRFPTGQMVRTFESALSRGPNASILALYGDYAANVLGEPDVALGMWREALRLQPTPVHRINLIKLLAATGRHAEARMQIAKLRRSGRLGQYEAEAARLESRLPGGS